MQSYVVYDRIQKNYKSISLTQLNAKVIISNTMSSCSRRKTKTPIRQSTPILLGDIHSHSTCIALKTPYYIACRNCKPQLDPLQNTRKKRKTERQKRDNRQCEKYWLPLM